jgi:hypothetical protein
MPSAPHRPHSSRVSGALAALCAVALGLAAPAPGAAGVDPPRITVRPSDFRSDPATTGGWLVDDVGPSNHATVTVASPQPGSGPQLLMHLENASDRAILHYRYAVNARPASTAIDDFATVRALLTGASYSFSTGTVNFQIGVFFRPVDPAFGPSGVGSAACSPATSFDTGWCFTTLKYQPFSAPSELRTVDLSATLDQGYVSSDHAGWWRSQRVGQYAKPGGPDNVSLENMLDEMSELIVYGFGVSIGTAATGDVTSWVRDFSFGGTSYGFGPNLPGPAPFASAEQLSSAAPPAAVMTSTGVDGSNSDLRRVRPTAPLEGEIEWTSTDSFVDVYAYSAPVYVGTFPVVGGRVQFSADVSGLSAGSHTLLFIGQQSAAQRVAGFSILALAPTGDDGLLLAAAALALVAAGCVLARRGRRAAIPQSRARLRVRLPQRLAPRRGRPRRVWLPRRG